MRWLVAAFLSICLVALPVVPAAVAAVISPACARMVEAGLLRGRGAGVCEEDSGITRAELITIIARAFSLEPDAEAWSGAAGFPDVETHWSRGYVGVGSRLIAARSGGRERLGFDDGTFRPDEPVTVAQALTLLMKFLGVAPAAGPAWPANYLSGAVQAGLLTEADQATVAGSAAAPATRGVAFWLADLAFSRYVLPVEGGTIYALLRHTLTARPVEGPMLEIPFALEPGLVRVYSTGVNTEQRTFLPAVKGGVTFLPVGSEERLSFLAVRGGMVWALGARDAAGEEFYANPLLVVPATLNVGTVWETLLLDDRFTHTVTAVEPVDVPALSYPSAFRVETVRRAAGAAQPEPWSVSWWVPGVGPVREERPDGTPMRQLVELRREAPRPVLLPVSVILKE